MPEIAPVQTTDPEMLRAIEQARKAEQEQEAQHRQQSQPQQVVAQTGPAAAGSAEAKASQQQPTAAPKQQQQQPGIASQQPAANALSQHTLPGTPGQQQQQQPALAQLAVEPAGQQVQLFTTTEFPTSDAPATADAADADAIKQTTGVAANTPTAANLEVAPVNPSAAHSISAAAGDSTGSAGSSGSSSSGSSSSSSSGSTHADTAEAVPQQPAAQPWNPKPIVVEQHKNRTLPAPKPTTKNAAGGVKSVGALMALSSCFVLLQLLL
jgi:hypothetical protein